MRWVVQICNHGNKLMGSKTLLMCNDCTDNGKREGVINAISNDHNNEQMENQRVRNEKKNLRWPLMLATNLPWKR